MLAIFIWLDAFALMSLREVSLLLLAGGLGALAAWPVSGRLIDTLPIGFSLYSRFVAPWLEEAIKAIIMITLFRMNRIGYKLDAVISGFAIGAGFSVVENIFYLTMFPEYGTGTWLVRGFGTAIMHGTTLASLAAIAHEFAERETRGAAADYDFNLLWFVPGYGVAVALHTAFNQFPDRPMVAMMGAILIAPVVLMAVLTLGTAEAQRWLAAESSEHRSQVAALRAGRWPDGTAGQKIAGLAARLESGKCKTGSALLGAAGVARGGSRGHHDGGGDRRRGVRRGRGALSDRRARRPQSRARPKHLHRAPGRASV